MDSSGLPNPSEAERHARVTEALARGEELRQAKEYDQSIDVLVEALQYGVEKAKIYFRLGNTYFDAGRLDHAEYAYRRAIDFDPAYVNAHHNLSVALRKQGKLSESVKLYRQAQRLAMKHPDRVQLNPEQTEHAKRIARRWLIAAGIILGIIVLGLILLSR
jgi:tetratricopeptide (TPR) repeat protein